MHVVKKRGTLGEVPGEGAAPGKGVAPWKGAAPGKGAALGKGVFGSSSPSVKKIAVKEECVSGLHFNVDVLEDLLGLLQSSGFGSGLRSDLESMV